MKKISLLLIFIIIATTLLPHASAKAKPVHTPQENPATADTSSAIALPILLRYADISSLLVAENYDDAIAMIKELALDQANMPADMKIIMQTYNNLFSDLTETLNSLNRTINEAEALLAQKKLKEIKRKIADAWVLVYKAESLLEDIDKATAKMISLLGPFIPITEVEAVAKARDRLLELIERLKQLELLYKEELLKLEAELALLEQLYPPDLTLETVSQAWVGDTITISGMLTAPHEAGKPLSDRNVTLFLDGLPITTVTTQADGSYLAAINILYEYIPKITVQASYVPEGQDTAKYLPSLSPAVEIEVRLHTTELTLNLDNTNPWVGDTITASGMLTSPEEAGKPLPGSDVAIFLDGLAVTTVTTQADGSYQAAIKIPYEYGTSSMTVQASYSPEGGDTTIYLPSQSPIIEIEVQFYPTNLTLNLDNTNPWVGDTITASGMLTSPDEAGKPLSDRNVTISLDGLAVTTVTTQADGSYQAAIKIPYEYVTSRIIQARYAAIQDKYAPSSSSPVAIEVQFYPTNLTLNLSSTNPWVGDTITASGVLTSPEEAGKPLPGRDITISLDGLAVATVTTQADGSYLALIEIPYEYITSRTVRAKYASIQDKYAPSSSPAVDIEVQFYTTELTLNLSSTNPWVGDTITTSGVLISAEENGKPLPSRDITISLDGLAVTTVTTQADGSYNGAVKIPYEYITPRTIQARYAYIEDKYTPSSSLPVEIEVQLHTTELTLNLDNTNPWVGDTITASGMLTSPDETGLPLPSRNVTISLDGLAVTTVTTQADGSYLAAVDIPYQYVPKMTIQATYTSEGEDTNKYLSCSSDPVDINILFYKTQLQIEVPEAYPGLPFKISGNITYGSGVPSAQRLIRVLWDNEPVDTFYSSQDAFETEVTPDAQTIVGEHLLTVIVESQDRYSGISVDQTMIVVKHTPVIEVDGIAFITPPRTVRIKGKLHSDLPLRGAMVTVELRGISTTVSTSANGEFEAILSLPLDSIVMGGQEVRIKVKPSEAWHLPTETKVEVFVVDIVNIGLAAAAFICIGVVLYTVRRSRRRGTPGEGDINILDTFFVPQEPTNISLQKLEGLEGTKAKVLKAYIEAAKIATATARVSMKPYMTLREFLKEAAPGLNNASKSFTELTRLAENALYSPNMPEADEALRAENLVLAMKEMLQHE